MKCNYKIGMVLLLVLFLVGCAKPVPVWEEKSGFVKINAEDINTNAVFAYTNLLTVNEKAVDITVVQFDTESSAEQFYQNGLAGLGSDTQGYCNSYEVLDAHFYTCQKKEFVLVFVHQNVESEVERMANDFLDQI